MEEIVHELQEHGKVNDTLIELSDDFNELQPYMVVFCVVGALTNGVLLYILAKINLHIAPKALILSLTLSNLFYLLFALPFETSAISTVGSQSYPFNEIVCKATETISSVSFFVWPLTLIALSNRHIHKGEDAGRTPKSTVTVIAIWIVAVVLALPTMIFSQIAEIDDNAPTSYCQAVNNGYLVFEILIELAIVVAVPLFAFGLYICRVATRFRQPNSEENDISNLVLVLVAVYALCHVPSALYEPLVALCLDKYNSFWHGFNNTRLCLYYAYPAASALALFCASKSFRQPFKRRAVVL